MARRLEQKGASTLPEVHQNTPFGPRAWQPRGVSLRLLAAPSRGPLRSGMAKLIYVANVSLDGYIEDAHGSFEWTAPNDEVFTFITDLVRPAGTYLYGRRLYETMAVWETDPTLAAQSELMADFANVWQRSEEHTSELQSHVN